MTEQTVVANHPQLQDYTLSVDEAARVLELPREEVMRAVRSGSLPSVTVGGVTAEYRLLPEDVLAFLMRGRAPDGTAQMDQAAGQVSSTEESGTAAPENSPVEGGDDPTDLALLDDTNALLRSLIEQLTESLSMVNQRLADENVRLRALVTAQADGLSQHREEHVRLQEQLAALPETVDGLQARLEAVQLQVDEMRALQARESEDAYRAALVGLRRRPWWAHIPDFY